MKCHSLFLTIIVCAIACTNQIAVGQNTLTENDYYQIQRYQVPPGVVLEGGAIEMLLGNKVAVSSRRGEIWIVDNAFTKDPTKDAKWTRFAHGLHEVLGLAFKDGWLYATQRGELTKIKDSNKDGIADVFLALNDGWEINGDYHEYAFGSRHDKNGDIWIVLCLTGSFNSSNKFRGWCVRVTPEGKLIPTCSGVRSPGGIGMNADGDVFYTDNQGPWNGTCGLKHLKPGGFMGHPASFTWYKDTKDLGKAPNVPVSGSRIMTEFKRVPELVPTAILFPYGKMGQSASGVDCDLSGGKFGPFQNQLFVGDQTHSTVMRVFLEKVKGYFQGACFPFRAGFGSGNVPLRFAPNGSLFVSGTNRGWGSRGNKPFAFERLAWTGKVPFEIHEMRAKHDGFLLTFTKEVNPKTASDIKSYNLQTYTYIYRAQYGSPPVDHSTAKITKAIVGPHRKSVRLFVEGLRIGHVHELHANGVRSATNVPLLHAQAYYTLNFIPPALVVSVPSTVKAGEPLNLTDIHYETINKITIAKLHYRARGAKKFTALNLSKGKDGRFAGAVPGKSTKTPLEFYVEMQFEGEGNIVYPHGSYEKPALVIPDATAPKMTAGPKVLKLKSYEVALGWQKATDDRGVAGYRVFRSERNGDVATKGKLLATLKPEQLVFRDQKPLVGKRVWYGIQPVDVAGRVGKPKLVVVNVPKDIAPALNLKISATAGPKAIVVAWNGTLEKDVKRMLIFRSAGKKDPFKQIAVVDSPNTAGRWADKNVKSGANYRYQVKLADAVGNVSDASIAVLAKAGLYLRRINCGGKKVIDIDGIAWEADDGDGGGLGRWVTTTTIKNAPKELQAVYQSERWSEFGMQYTFDVRPGKYAVTLFLAETNEIFAGKGKRTFDVEINGKKRHEKLDVFAKVGANTAYRLRTEVDLKNEKQIVVVLRKVAAGPALKGIEIRELAESK